ncbi:hypothetical protein GCM10027595_21540 [Corynebacterium nasicanis]
MAVLAARGSDQNEELAPTVYSPGSPWVSNGYEERTIRAFLHTAESRHPGLLRDVPVVALDAQTYAAELPLPALAREDEEIALPEMLGRVGALLAENPAHVIAHRAATGFEASLRGGVDNALGFVDAWEERTGCAPGYILVGYSQGAAVLSAQEQALAERGQLVASLYMGNPLLRQGEGPVVGQPARGGGMMSSMPAANATDSQRLNYCNTDDFACDLTSSAANKALSGGGGVHTQYYMDAPTENDAQVADTFAGWIRGYTSRP